MAMMQKFKIVGYGQYLPKRIQTSEELDIVFNQAKGWTEENFSIKTRHIANRDETTSFMAAEACEEALKQSQWEAGEFDVIIGACGVMEQPIPNVSAMVQAKLGLDKSGIYCFDVNMTCLSFLSALDIAARGIASGQYRRALVFSSDIASAGLDYENPKSSAIFGDGAAAICIEACDKEEVSCMLASRFRTYSSGIDTAHLRAGGTNIRIDDGFDALKDGAKFYMNSSGILRAVGKYLGGFIKDTLKDANIEAKDLDLIICHQASAQGLEYFRHLLKDQSGKIVDVFAQYGNQIATSIPNSLYHAHKNGRIKSGDTILIIGTSAGISLGAMVLKV